MWHYFEKKITVHADIPEFDPHNNEFDPNPLINDNNPDPFLFGEYFTDIDGEIYIPPENNWNLL